MKKILTTCKITLVFVVCAALLQGCLKDSATKTYTLFTPVYKSATEVHAGIKSDAAMPIVNTGKIFVLGNYIFLNEVDKGVHIIDNTNPSAPLNKYFISIPGNLDLAVKGNILYADLYTDLVAIDITNPAAIAVKKITRNVFPPRQYPGFFIQDTSRVIVDWTRKDTTVTVNEPLYNPGGIIYTYMSLASSAAAMPAAVGVSGSTARFALLNNYLYTVSNSALNVFDVSQSENPLFTSQKSIGWRIETISTFKNNLFIGSQAGMYIFGTANPAQPDQRSMFGHATACDPVIADENYAYVTLHTGTICHAAINQLDIISISDLNNVKYVRSYPLTNPHGLAKAGNTLFICDGAAGLKIFDATDVSNLQLQQTISDINATDVIAINNNAIVVAADGLYQYDYSNNKQIVLRSKITYSKK